MNVQSISLTQSQKPAFKAAERKSNVDRTPTVQDLYDMEDRLKAHQTDLIAKQNSNIAKALIYIQTGEQNMYDKKCDNPAKIINGIMRQPQAQEPFYYDPRFGEQAAKYLTPEE